MNATTPSSNQRGIAHRPNSVGAAVSAFESETAAVFERTTPGNEHIILYVLVAMLVLSFALSSVVKLDRVVTSVGRVVPIGGQLYVSPLDRAIVRDVRVKSGDVVKKGDVLATLDPTFTKADLTQLEEKMQSNQAEVDRLQAEYENKPYTPSGKSRSEEVQAAIRLQRQSEFRSSLADFDARIANAASTAAGYQHDMEEYAKRHKLAEEQENMSTTLAKSGYVSKLQEMASIDSRVEVGRLMTAAKNQRAATEETLNSLRAQRAAFVQKWSSDLSSALVTARTSLEETRDSYQKAKKLDELSALVAPADAIVLKVGKVSAGSVADASGSSNIQEPLFTLVPLDAPVEADVAVDARDIGFIQPGDVVQIKLDAYRFMQHGTAKGVIKTISEGSFTTDEITNQPVPAYFKARVSFTDTHLRNVPDTFRLVPGMTVQGDIMVGRRTILSYLIEGALRTGSEAMREP